MCYGETAASNDRFEVGFAILVFMNFVLLLLFGLIMLLTFKVDPSCDRTYSVLIARGEKDGSM